MRDSIVIGMPLDLYLNGDINLFDIYLDAFKLKKKILENEMYLKYQYQISALATMFSKDALIKKPIRLYENKEDDKEKVIDEKVREYLMGK